MIKFLGRRFEIIGQVVEFDPNKKIAMQVLTGPFPMALTMTVEGIGQESRLTTVLEADPGTYFRLAGPLVKPLLQRQLDADHATLKALVEEGVPALLNRDSSKSRVVLLIRNRFVPFVSVFISICVASCGGAAATPKANSISSGVQHGSLTIAGLKRTYRLYIPPSLDLKHPAPLVVKLHGCLPGANGDGDAAATHFDDEASTGRFVAVYPDGLNYCWNGGNCCTNADDVTFISRLLDRLVKDLPINQSRVFATGVSGGGFMSYRLACELSTRFIAIASISGTMVFDNCHPARPVSILEMHGTNDSNVPYGGVPNGPPSVAAVIQSWTALDGCVGNPIQSQTGITKTSVWKGCKGGAIVRLDTVVGGHHTWFGSSFDPIPGEPNANAVIWDFFSQLAPTA